MPIVKYFIKLKTILNTDILMLGLRTKCTYNLANYWSEFVLSVLSCSQRSLSVLIPVNSINDQRKRREKEDALSLPAKRLARIEEAARCNCDCALCSTPAVRQAGRRRRSHVSCLHVAIWGAPSAWCTARTTREWSPQCSGVSSNQQAY